MRLADSEGNEYPSGRQGLGQPDTSLPFMLPPNTVLSSLLRLHLDVRVTGKRIPRYDGGSPIMPVFEAPAGPFKFDFSLPFFPARIIEVNQTIEAEGTAITLERISIAPSGVQAHLLVPRPAEDTPRTVVQVQARLDTPDCPYRFGHGSATYVLPGQISASCSFPDSHFDEAPLYKQGGEWSLTLNGMQYRDASQRMPPLPGVVSDPRNGMVGARGVWVPAGEPMPTLPGHTAIPGEWAFNFTVPPTRE